jgi:twitching motility protein PilT
MHAREASDLHLVPGYRPMFRIGGVLLPALDAPLADGAVPALLAALAPDETFDDGQGADADFAVHLDPPGGPRFRVNVFSSRGRIGACFRAIPDRIPDLDSLGFPADLANRIAAQRNGLVLVTGITGSGKTTTLASLIQRLNAQGGFRIITIEEPIEYLYPAAADSIVTQREVGRDVASFYDGLRYGLRQDPDVILVGEIRDRETAQLALSAAETGHLIFATMHTTDAKGAITRMIDLFPPEQHADIRTQLSLSLRFVIAQHLLPAGDAGRRVLATEALSASFAVRSAIRQGQIEKLESAIQSGRRDGMWTLDMDLRRLLGDGRISAQTAREFAKDPSEF